MDEKKSIFKEFLQLTCAAFTGAVLFMSVIGWFVGNLAEGTTTIFAMGDAGLAYQTIFQILAFSIINSGISLLFTLIFKNKMLLWALISTLFTCLAVSSIMVAVFGWIPFDSWEAWLWFFTSFVVIFSVIAVVLVVKTLLEDKKYEKLLSDYKAKQKLEEEDI